MMECAFKYQESVTEHAHKFRYDKRTFPNLFLIHVRTQKICLLISNYVDAREVNQAVRYIQHTSCITLVLISQH